MTFSRMMMWLAVPLAVALGAAVGIVATQKLATPPPPVALAMPEPPKPVPMLEPVPPIPPIPNPGRRSPFDDNKPAVPSPGGRTPFVLEGPDGKPLPPAEMPAEEPEPKVEPPLVYRNGRVELDVPPSYFDVPASDKKDGTDPPLIKVGYVLEIEVLEALPGRPLSGQRVVRPDGTISLGYYGDLRVVGLNRVQAKARLIERMRIYLSDEALGLMRTIDGADGGVTKFVAVRPEDSNRFFVDESLNFATVQPDGTKGDPGLLILRSRIDKIEEKIDRLLGQKNQPTTGSSPESPADPFSPSAQPNSPFTPPAKPH